MPSTPGYEDTPLCDAVPNRTHTRERKDLPKERRKNENCGGEGKKSAILVWRRGGPVEGRSGFQSVDRIWPNRIWPNLVFSCFGQIICSWCLLVLVGACWAILAQAILVRAGECSSSPLPRQGGRSQSMSAWLRVADGLPLFHGAQFAVDATLVSADRGDGSARGQCADHDGAVLEQSWPAHGWQSTSGGVGLDMSELLKHGCGLRGRRGSHTTAQEPKRAHLSAPALQTPPKRGRKE